jgi:hypothetical protein
MEPGGYRNAYLFHNILQTPWFLNEKRLRAETGYVHLHGDIRVIIPAISQYPFYHKNIGMSVSDQISAYARYIRKATPEI